MLLRFYSNLSCSSDFITIQKLLMKYVDIDFDNAKMTQTKQTILEYIKWNIRMKIHKDTGMVGLYVFPHMSPLGGPFKVEIHASFLSPDGNPSQKKLQTTIVFSCDDFQKKTLWGQDNICHFNDLPVQDNGEDLRLRFRAKCQTSGHHMLTRAIVNHYLSDSSIDMTMCKRIEELEAKVEKDKTIIADLRRTVEKGKVEIGMQGDIIVGLERDLQKKDEEAKEKDEEISDLESRIKRSDDVILSREETIAVLEQDLKEKEEEAKKKNEEIEALKEELKKRKETAEKCEEEILVLKRKKDEEVDGLKKQGEQVAQNLRLLSEQFTSYLFR